MVYFFILQLSLLLVGSCFMLHRFLCPWSSCTVRLIWLLTQRLVRLCMRKLRAKTRSCASTKVHITLSWKVNRTRQYSKFSMISYLGSISIPQEKKVCRHESGSVVRQDLVNSFGNAVSFPVRDPRFNGLEFHFWYDPIKFLVLIIDVSVTYLNDVDVHIYNWSMCIYLPRIIWENLSYKTPFIFYIFSDAFR